MIRDKEIFLLKIDETDFEEKVIKRSSGKLKEILLTFFKTKIFYRTNNFPFERKDYRYYREKISKFNFLNLPPREIDKKTHDNVVDMGGYIYRDMFKIYENRETEYVFTFQSHEATYTNGKVKKFYFVNFDEDNKDTLIKMLKLLKIKHTVYKSSVLQKILEEFVDI